MGRISWCVVARVEITQNIAALDKISKHLSLVFVDFVFKDWVLGFQLIWDRVNYFENDLSFFVILVNLHVDDILWNIQYYYFFKKLQISFFQ